MKLCFNEVTVFVAQLENYPCWSFPATGIPGNARP